MWSGAGGSETLTWEDAARLVDYRDSPKASTERPVIIRVAQNSKISLSHKLHPSQITEVYSKTGPIKKISVYLASFF